MIVLIVLAVIGIALVPFIVHGVHASEKIRSEVDETIKKDGLHPVKREDEA